MNSELCINATEAFGSFSPQWLCPVFSIIALRTSCPSVLQHREEQRKAAGHTVFEGKMTWWQFSRSLSIRESAMYVSLLCNYIYQHMHSKFLHLLIVLNWINLCDLNSVLPVLWDMQATKIKSTSKSYLFNWPFEEKIMSYSKHDTISSRVLSYLSIDWKQRGWFTKPTHHHFVGTLQKK